MTRQGTANTNRDRLRPGFLQFTSWWLRASVILLGLSSGLGCFVDRLGLTRLLTLVLWLLDSCWTCPIFRLDRRFLLSSLQLKSPLLFLLPCLLLASFFLAGLLLLAILLFSLPLLLLLFGRAARSSNFLSWRAWDLLRLRLLLLFVVDVNAGSFLGLSWLLGRRRGFLSR